MTADSLPIICVRVRFRSINLQMKATNDDVDVKFQLPNRIISFRDFVFHFSSAKTTNEAEFLLGVGSRSIATRDGNFPNDEYNVTFLARA